MSDSKKKKKAIGLELTLGGGLLILFLPCILFATVGAVWGVIVSISGHPFMFDATEISGQPLLLIFSLLLLVTLYVTFKFSARFILLTRRLVGILRERRRIRTQTHVLETSAPAASYEVVTEQKASER